MCRWCTLTYRDHATSSGEHGGGGSDGSGGSDGGDGGVWLGI